MQPRRADAETHARGAKLRKMHVSDARLQKNKDSELPSGAAGESCREQKAAQVVFERKILIAMPTTSRWLRSYSRVRDKKPSTTFKINRNIKAKKGGTFYHFYCCIFTWCKQHLPPAATAEKRRLKAAAEVLITEEWGPAQLIRRCKLAGDAEAKQTKPLQARTLQMLHFFFTAAE